MTNKEILSNLDYYDSQIKSLWPGLQPKRAHMDKGFEFNNFQTDGKVTSYDPIIKHARYLINSMRKMIKMDEKEQRIHRHYGFLQCLLLVIEVVPSIKSLMFENKYGAKKYHTAMVKYGDQWEKKINSVESKDWDGKD